MSYQCYGLRISSELALPELGMEVPQLGGQADLSITLSPVPADGMPGAHHRDPFLQVADQTLWLNVPDVARFLIHQGREIRVDALPEHHPLELRAYLLGSALGAALIQRGFLVLHGNAISLPDGVLVCVGESGAGKSTLATAFVQAGYGILADDVLPVDSSGLGYPGFPRLKLWQDAADGLGIDTSGLQRVSPAFEKFSLPLNGSAFDGKPGPVKWVFVLEPEDRESLVLEEIRGMAALHPLHQHTYRVHFLETPHLQSAHLQQCANLAGQIRLVRLRRPRHGFPAPSLMAAILQWIAQHGGPQI